MSNSARASQHIADAAAATSVALAGLTLADLDHVVSICAGIAAIIAALIAARYHWKRTPRK